MVFSLVIYLGIFVSSQYLLSSRARMEINFFNQNSYMPYGQAFSHLVFSWVLLWVIPDVFPPKGLLQVLVILFHVIYSFSLSVMFFPFPYFTPKLFCFLWFWLLVCACAFSIYSEFSFVVLERPVLFVLLDLSQYILCPSSFTNIFDISFQVALSNLSAVLFWSFHLNISLCFSSLVSSFVVAISLPVLLA